MDLIKDKKSELNVIESGDIPLHGQIILDSETKNSNKLRKSNL